VQLAKTAVAILFARIRPKILKAAPLEFPNDKLLWLEPQIRLLAATTLWKPRLIPSDSSGHSIRA
jgi:hypothetical protein